MVKKSWFGLGILVVGVGLFISQGALAGARATSTVTIRVQNGDDHEFFGSLGSARNSADATQYIGCTTDNIDGYCTARNSAGTTVTCFSDDPEIIATMRSVNGDSYIFVDWDGVSTCRRVSVNNRSSWAPKNP